MAYFVTRRLVCSKTKLFPSFVRYPDKYDRKTVSGRDGQKGRFDTIVRGHEKKRFKHFLFDEF